jgi:iron complex transport system ATP-binding protein
MKALLTTQDLTMGYATCAIAEPLSLTLQVGEFVCLLGPNGAGKSTLLRTLAGMQPPLAGSVTVGSDDLHRLTARELAQRVAVVLTERTDVGRLTAYGLAALGRYPYTDWRGTLSATDDAAVRAALAAVGAERLAQRAVQQLSDGERQKVMIARALAQETPLLLLDEPTAFLDLPRRVELMHMLRRLAHESGRAVLLSTHDLELALRTADRVWLLAQGKLCSGAPEDLVLNGAFAAAFAADGVVFDSATGSFSFPQKGAAQVTLLGDGSAVLWTQQALARAGYSLADDAAVRVQVLTHEDAARWQVWINGQCREYASVEALLAALRDSAAEMRNR